MKRVRFKTVSIGDHCQTEWKENIMKIKEVRIQTNGNINYRNAVNLETGELLPIDLAQWVWVKNENNYCEWIKYDYRTIAPREHDVNNPYWRIPENMDKLKYCPYCGKEIKVID